MRYGVYLSVFLIYLFFPVSAPLWKLDQPHENATPDQSSDQRWEAAGDHNEQPSKLAVSIQFGPEVGGSDEAQYTNLSGYRENERADRDLRAQEEMARWAFWMMALTGATVFVTFVGVSLVGFTLSETRRLRREAEKTTTAALDAARFSEEGAKATLKAAEAAIEANDQARLFFVEQERARLSVNAVVTKIVWLEHEVQITVAINMKNVGETNANNVFERIEVIFEPYPPMNKIEDIIKRNISKSGSFGYTIEKKSKISISNTVSTSMESLKEWNFKSTKERLGDLILMPTLLICCTYNIVFDKELRHTSIIRWITRKDGKVVTSSGGDLAVDQIQTRRNLKGDMIAT